MPRVALFGATGFIGSSVLASLVRRLHDTEVLCFGRRQAHGVPFVRFDLATDRPATLGSLLADWRPDSVINCSGAVVGGPAELVAGNVATAATLIEAVSLGAPHAQVVHLGSAAEYGPSTPHVPTSEEQPADPVSYYGVCKLAATRLMLTASREKLDRVTVLRAFNPIGAGGPRHSVLGRAAELIAEAAALGRRTIELGPLDAYRDFVPLADVARAVLMVAMPDETADVERTSDRGAVINIGSGEALRVREAVARLCEVAGFDGEVLERSSGSPRSADVSWQAADVTSAERLLGWRPSGDLRSSLVDLWRSAQDAFLVRGGAS